MQDLSHFADANPVNALELRDRSKDAVLRPSNSDAPCEMGTDGFHPHRNGQKIIDQLAKPAIAAAFKQG
jgi:lysophospholipase L1-like esterase